MSTEHPVWKLELQMHKKNVSSESSKIKIIHILKDIFKDENSYFCDQKSHPIPGRGGITYLQIHWFSRGARKRSMRSLRTQWRAEAEKQVLRARRAWFGHQKPELRHQGYRARLHRNKTQHFQTSKRSGICANTVDSYPSTAHGQPPASRLGEQPTSGQPWTVLW